VKPASTHTHITHTHTLPLPHHQKTNKNKKAKEGKEMTKRRFADHDGGGDSDGVGVKSLMELATLVAIDNVGDARVLRGLCCVPEELAERVLAHLDAAQLAQAEAHAAAARVRFRTERWWKRLCEADHGITAKPADRTWRMAYHEHKRADAERRAAAKAKLLEQAAAHTKSRKTVVPLSAAESTALASKPRRRPVGRAGITVGSKSMVGPLMKKVIRDMNRKGLKGIW
jgi:hypothetical protein